MRVRRLLKAYFLQALQNAPYRPQAERPETRGRVW